MTAAQTWQLSTSPFDVPLTVKLRVDDAELEATRNVDRIPTYELRRTTSVVELSLTDLANDPLIALLNRADGINRESFSQLMQSAARVGSRCRPGPDGRIDVPA